MVGGEGGSGHWDGSGGMQYHPFLLAEMGGGSRKRYRKLEMPGGESTHPMCISHLKNIFFYSYTVSGIRNTDIFFLPSGQMVYHVWWPEMLPWSSWPHEGDLLEVLGPNGSKGCDIFC